MFRTLLTTKEAAQKLGVTESFLVQDRFYGGGIPFVKLGHRSVRYKPEDLEAYINANTFTSTSQFSASQQALATA